MRIRHKKKRIVHDSLNNPFYIHFFIRYTTMAIMMTAINPVIYVQYFTILVYSLSSQCSLDSHFS